VVAQRVFHDRLVRALAQDQPDRRVVLLALDEIVDGGEIEPELADILRLERADLQLDDDVAAQAQLVEQQVEVMPMSA
jgi:hypothetical protein